MGDQVPGDHTVKIQALTIPSGSLRDSEGGRVWSTFLNGVRGPAT